jgi:hypothetical protein
VTQHIVLADTLRLSLFIMGYHKGNIYFFKLYALSSTHKGTITQKTLPKMPFSACLKEKTNSLSFVKRNSFQSKLCVSIKYLDSFYFGKMRADDFIVRKIVISFYCEHVRKTVFKFTCCLRLL